MSASALGVVKRNACAVQPRRVAGVQGRGVPEIACAEQAGGEWEPLLGLYQVDRARRLRHGLPGPGDHGSGLGDTLPAVRLRARGRGDGPLSGPRPGWRLGEGRCRRRLPALARVGGSEPPSCLGCSTWLPSWGGASPGWSAGGVGCPGGVLVGPAASLVSVEARGGSKLNQCLGLNCLCNLSRRVQSESRLPGLRLPELLPDPGGAAADPGGGVELCGLLFVSGDPNAGPA